ncbi:polysaccharide biosynthesis protein [Mariniblastus fucicola]|uniref:UDP-N-acetyl-alpha-D-glucosamine C6 dehydratase n=1 Tax=Mariniblastus fucicola TaxID=980251 RepID=A0A5B9PHH0_9BACT|nr:nucleoside-diphosphate sugar epimerase/dehydratase [Mariniblastus fucicola]QEG22321.1 UDP-N-acetyl-alpha-D-glucosamine C6 dehydratase [Mariniblastus fucicola]
MSNHTAESDRTDSKESTAFHLRLRDRLVSMRLALLIVCHLFAFAAIYWAAFLMRFTLDIPLKYQEIYWANLPFVVGLKLLVFYALGSFHGWWRHVNFSDFIALLRSAVAASLLIIAFDYFVMQNWQHRIPRIVLVNDFVMTIVVLGGLRSCWRVWDERIAPLDGSRVTDRALIVGSDFDTAKLAHLINGQTKLGIRIVGMVSALDQRNGRRYSDLRVVGTLEDLSTLMQQHRTTTLFVVTGTLKGRRLRDLLDSASDRGFKIKILPPLNDHLRGADSVPIREVSYNDLLRREPADLNLGAIEKIVDGKTVLVTGAGGSIGSELCRQLSRFHPRKMILLGRGENRIYHIERELNDNAPHIRYVPRIANITDAARIREIFETLKPDLVFHAAAHKHVPLVEENVGESIINNILGTKVMADHAHEFGVDRFVMVSTDKSVNPTSIMGCTKQMAERYCQTIGQNSKTAFISTRFGNVLGSAGSVVPLFQEQIRRGGPITITDKRMTRYFMTIPEASQLVIQAASMGSGGEIFVLEMGEPVKIIDLANDLIRLAGHSPGSIEIVEKGMRPGEKLYEELYYGDEKSIPTSHDQILSSHSRAFRFEEVEHQVHTLIESAYADTAVIRGLIKKFVPEYGGQPAKPQQRKPNSPEKEKIQ